MKFLYLVALFSIAFAVCNAADNCHLRNVEVCMAGIAALSTSPQASIPIDEAGVDKQCLELKDMNGCLKNYTDKCATPLMKEILKTTNGNSQKYIDRFCTPGGDLRTNYLKHAECLREAAGVEEVKLCVNDVQASIDLLTEDTEKPFELGCCTYDRFRKCSEKIVKDKCGDEAIQYANFLMQNGFGSIMNKACGCLDQAECEAVLPPSGTQPQGKKSNSPIARILANFFPRLS